MFKSLKLLCSLLLLVCICLPLSQCSGPVTEGATGPAPLVSLYVFGESLDLTDHDDLLSIAAWTLPAVLALLSFRRPRSLLLIFADLITSLGALVFWLRIFLLSEQLVWAGYVAAGAIAVLIALALLEGGCMLSRQLNVCWRTKAGD